MYAGQGAKVTQNHVKRFWRLRAPTRSEDCRGQENLAWADIRPWVERGDLGGSPGAAAGQLILGGLGSAGARRSNYAGVSSVQVVGVLQLRQLGGWANGASVRIVDGGGRSGRSPGRLPACQSIPLRAWWDAALRITRSSATEKRRECEGDKRGDGSRRFYRIGLRVLMAVGEFCL